MPVQWCKTLDSWMKLNLDGSSLGNPSSIRGGGITKKRTANILVAYSIPFGVSSNNKVEIEAAVFGLAWCLHLGCNSHFGGWL